MFLLAGANIEPISIPANQKHNYFLIITDSSPKGLKWQQLNPKVILTPLYLNIYAVWNWNRKRKRNRRGNWRPNGLRPGFVGVLIWVISVHNVIVDTNGAKKWSDLYGRKVRKDDGLMNTIWDIRIRKHPEKVKVEIKTCPPGEDRDWNELEIGFLGNSELGNCLLLYSEWFVCGKEIYVRSEKNYTLTSSI